MATQRPNTFPDDPEAAVMLAIIYQQLGGSFSVASNGKRYFGRPEPALFGLCEGEDFPGSKFFAVDPDGWDRSIRFCETLLRCLSSADTDLVYDLYAAVAVDDRKFIPSIEEPRRPRS